MNEYYYYGLAAMLYITTCWAFAVVRWFHTCQEPKERAYLDPHLKVDDVVEHCQLGRTYVSLTFQRRFGSFSNYVNSLRLAHYEQYTTDHPDETKESAAIASGFSNYMACYRAKQKQNRR